MDREALKKAAQSRRVSESDEPVVAVKPTWDCTACGHQFKFEKTFMNHVCKERLRLEELKSVIGQAGYGYYSQWMRTSGRSVPPIETFMHSSLYTVFIKFARHVQKVNMPAPHAFIKMMVDQKILPSLWCRDNVYAMYMGQYDKQITPETQFIDSADFMYEYALKHEIEVDMVFENMGVDKLLVNVQKRKLSPWYLAASTNFRNWLKTLEDIDAQQVEESVKVGALMLQLRGSAEKTKMFSEFSKACKEMNI